MNSPPSVTIEPEPLTIPLDTGDRTSAVFYSRPSKPGQALVILAHGAGAGQTHPFMVRFARGLAERGFDVLTFNFPYVEHRRRVPDPAARLEACYRAAIAQARRVTDRSRGRLIIGGKSMGGRIASQVAAAAGDDETLDGLVLLGYPLHPPGKPEQLRTAHLHRVRAPMLFVQGARDAFGTPEELRGALAGLQGRATLYVVPDGDHSFGVPKGAARSRDEVYDAVLAEIARWIDHLAGR